MCNALKLRENTSSFIFLYWKLPESTLFLFATLQIGGVMDQGETPLRLMLRPPFINQGAIWHISVGSMDITWPQSSKQRRAYKLQGD